MTTLYRVQRRLTTGDEPGDFVEGSKFKQLDKLVAAGVLEEVHPPPLSEIPGWRLRSERLAGAGIVTALDFLEASKEQLMQIFEHKTDAHIANWQAEIREWLQPSRPKKRWGH